MEQCISCYEKGHIKPIRPVQVFSAAQVTEAFRCMQRGLHIGKILVAMPESGSKTLTAAKMRRQTTLSGKHCYLLVGGLGGLGKALTTWMVERGAKNIVFLSRSAGKSSEDQEFLRELESQDCRAVAIAGSVVELSDVQRAVRAAPAPIAGVIQMSMVLRVWLALAPWP
jgi:D-arabinose 1-dehydrogenase-like Zn-dependent alcohol dehydrogenase